MLSQGQNSSSKPLRLLLEKEERLDWQLAIEHFPRCPLPEFLNHVTIGHEV